MSTKQQLLLLTQIRHMLIEPLVNWEVVKTMRHIANARFLTSKELFIRRKWLLLLPIALR